MFGWWGVWRERASAKWASKTLTFAFLTPTLSLSSCTHTQIYLHTSKHFAVRAKIGNILWHTRKGEEVIQCNIHIHMHTHIHTIWPSAWTLRPWPSASSSSSISQAVCLEADRVKGGRGGGGESGKGLVISMGMETRRRGEIEHTPDPLIHSWQPPCRSRRERGREEGPANICDGSTPTD